MNKSDDKTGVCILQCKSLAKSFFRIQAMLLSDIAISQLDNYGKRGIMHFGNFLEMSGKTGKDRKLKQKFRMPFGKRRVHSVSGHHHGDH